MEFLEYALFENPLPACLMLLVAEAVVAAVWLRRRTRPWAAAMLAAPLLAGAVLLAGHLVQTDRERIAAILAEIAADAGTGRLDAAERHMHPQCLMPVGAGAGLDRSDIVRWGRGTLKRYGVVTVAVTGVDTVLTGDRAVTALGTVVTLRTGQRYQLRWRLSWTADGGRWRIVRIEMTSPQSIRDLVF